MIPILRSDNPNDRARLEQMLRRLRLDPAAVALGEGDADVAAVRATLADVAKRGDEAIVELSRRFDDPNFSADQIRVSPAEMRDAAARVPGDLMSALRRS